MQQLRTVLKLTFLELVFLLVLLSRIKNKIQGHLKCERKRMFYQKFKNTNFEKNKMLLYNIHFYIK